MLLPSTCANSLFPPRVIDSKRQWDVWCGLDILISNLHSLLEEEQERRGEKHLSSELQQLPINLAGEGRDI